MKIAVVLFNLGGPDELAAVKPFLFNLFNDPAIIGAPTPIRYLLARLISSRREKKAQAIYAQMGGRSPILPQTQAQAEALQQVLNDGGADQWRCFIAMRYWNPRAEQALRDVIQWGPDRVVLLPLYPQFSTTTTGSSLREWRSLAEAAGLRTTTSALCCYHSSAGWIEAVAYQTRSAIQSAGDNPLVLFSAHGLPQKVIDAGDPYQWQVEQTVESIRRALAPLPFESRVCYQSRVGPLKWIGPSTDECIAVAAKAGRNIVVVPVAFVSEHSETLVELDIEYRHLAKSHGAKSYARVPTVQAQPLFIGQLARLARQAVAGDAAIGNGGQGLCPLNTIACPCRQSGANVHAADLAAAAIAGAALTSSLPGSDGLLTGGLSPGPDPASLGPADYGLNADGGDAGGDGGGSD